MFESLPINSIVQLITAIAALGTCLLLWKFRHATEVRFLMLLEIFVAIWAMSYALEFGTPVKEKKVFLSQLSYLGIVFIPVSYFFFTTAFSQKLHLINKRNIILSLIIPLITLFIVFTNHLHHLIWKEMWLDSEANILHYTHGFWFWFFYSYTFILIVLGITNLISSISKFTSYYKKQLRILLIASAIPVVANLMYVFNLNPFPGFDWTTVSFVLTGLVIAWGIFRYKIFELVPLAQEKLLDTMNDGVLVVNANGIIEAANPSMSAIFNLDEHHVEHSDFKQIFQNYPQIINLIQTGEDNEVDFALQKDGQQKYYLLKISSIHNQLGHLNGKLMVITDVTSLRTAELKLKQKNKQLREEIKRNEKLIDDLDAYAHTLAHDLKNSLGTIYTSSDIILESIEQNDISEIKEYSKIVKESALKTITVTNELLKMATAGHGDVKVVPTEMQSVYQDAIEQISNIINEYKAEITFEGKWINALAFAPWIEEVWANLLTNALKYGGTPPKVTVGCVLEKDGKVKYWIKDNGDGVPEHQQQKIFRKHTRLQPDKVNGYGLGLSIVKRIVEKLNGKVGIISSGESGAGSIFYFKLPAVQ